MDVTVTFKHAGAWQPKRKRTAFEAPFQRLYGNSLENYATVRRATRPSVSAAATPDCGEEYLIVTDTPLRPAADLLADAKSAAGLRTVVHEVPTGTSAVDIRSFIRGELNSTTCVRPTYVALIGDTSHIPSFLEPCTGLADCAVTSDLSYSLDGVGTDAVADVMLG